MKNIWKNVLGVALIAAISSGAAIGTSTYLMNKNQRPVELASGVENTFKQPYRLTNYGTVAAENIDFTPAAESAIHGVVHIKATANAQASKSGVLFADHSVEDFKLAIHSGLYAAFYYMKECFPYLKQSKQPRVINFASAAGVYGNMGQTSYAAAKEGIRGMSRVAAREWGEFGITVNIICPLAMTEQLAKWAEAEPEMAKANLKSITLGRYGDPEKDIGRTCLFLASEDAAYITGQTIHVDGGGGIRP